MSPLIALWRSALRGLVRSWWRWALHDLQAQDAAHPDLPLIVRRLRELQR
jgi:hypothetical protein